MPPLPTTGANMEWVEGGVATTGELTISFSEGPPSAQEVLGNPPLPPTADAEVGGVANMEEEEEEGAIEAACWVREGGGGGGGRGEKGSEVNAYGDGGRERGSAVCATSTAP